MLIRLLLAMLVGGFIGLEREKKKRGAGFRTYMLVALGSALTIILSQYLDLMLNTAWSSTAEIVGIKTDVSRFGAQVINGMGFLGAGTIIVTSHQEVKGLTTAAGLWASACVGLAIGAGFYECVVICFVLILLIMGILPFVEHLFRAKTRYMNISIEMESLDYIGCIIATLKESGIRILSIETDKYADARLSQAGAAIDVYLPKKQNHTNVIAMLSMVEGVITIDEI